MQQAKSIKGKQQSPTPTAPSLGPNHLDEACICVPKVYDWLLATSWERLKLPLPDLYRPLLQTATDEGQEISVHCLDPFSPDRSTARSCRVLAGPRKINIHVSGHVVPAGIVRTLFQTSVTLYFLADHQLLFDYSAPVHMENEIVVCLPEPLDEKNIRCRVATGECIPFTGFLPSGFIELELFLCLEISVETRAIMEVMAKACEPRPDFIPIPLPTLAACKRYSLQPPRVPRLWLDA